MFYLHYVQDCSPKLKSFKSLKALDAFVKKFKYDDDSWLDFVIEGTPVVFYDQHYAKCTKRSEKK